MSFDYLERGDAGTVLKKLKGVGYKAQDVFTIGNSEELMEKAELPYLAPWIKETLNSEFEDKDPREIYKELIDTTKNLEVSGVGCKQLKCKQSVSKVGKIYDGLIAEAQLVR